MNALKSVLIVLVIPVLNGCFVLHSGSIGGGSTPGRQDQYVDVANGAAKSVFVFGFGDLDNENLVRDAKLNMYYNRPLKKGEYYSNIATSITNKFIFGFIHVTQVNVSSDVLRMNDSLSEVFSNSFKEKTNVTKISNQPHTNPQTSLVEVKTNDGVVHVGDSVYFAGNSSDYKLYVVSSIGKENVLLLATNPYDKNTLTSKDRNFFIKNQQLNGFGSGDVVIAEIIDTYNSTVFEEGRILGVSSGYILVITKSGFHVLPEVKLKRKK
jgi:hypothetical protein